MFEEHVKELDQIRYEIDQIATDDLCSKNTETNDDDKQCALNSSRKKTKVTIRHVHNYYKELYLNCQKNNIRLINTANHLKKLNNQLYHIISTYNSTKKDSFDINDSIQKIKNTVDRKRTIFYEKPLVFASDSDEFEKQQESIKLAADTIDNLIKTGIRYGILEKNINYNACSTTDKFFYVDQILTVTSNVAVLKHQLEKKIDLLGDQIKTHVDQFKQIKAQAQLHTQAAKQNNLDFSTLNNGQVSTCIFQKNEDNSVSINPDIAADQTSKSLRTTGHQNTVASNIINHVTEHLKDPVSEKTVSQPTIRRVETVLNAENYNATSNIEQTVTNNELNIGSPSVITTNKIDATGTKTLVSPKAQLSARSPMATSIKVAANPIQNEIKKDRTVDVNLKLGSTSINNIKQLAKSDVTPIKKIPPVLNKPLTPIKVNDSTDANYGENITFQEQAGVMILETTKDEKKLSNAPINVTSVDSSSSPLKLPPMKLSNPLVVKETYSNPNVFATVKEKPTLSTSPIKAVMLTTGSTMKTEKDGGSNDHFNAMFSQNKADLRSEDRADFKAIKSQENRGDLAQTGGNTNPLSKAGVDNETQHSASSYNEKIVKVDAISSQSVAANDGNESSEHYHSKVPSIITKGSEELKAKPALALKVKPLTELKKELPEDLSNLAKSDINATPALSVKAKVLQDTKPKPPVTLATSKPPAGLASKLASSFKLDAEFKTKPPALPLKVKTPPGLEAKASVELKPKPVSAPLKIKTPPGVGLKPVSELKTKPLPPPLKVKTSAGLEAKHLLELKPKPASLPLKVEMPSGVDSKPVPELNSKPTPTPFTVETPTGIDSNLSLELNSKLTPPVLKVKSNVAIEAKSLTDLKEKSAIELKTKPPPPPVKTKLDSVLKVKPRPPLKAKSQQQEEAISLKSQDSLKVTPKPGFTTLKVNEAPIIESSTTSSLSKQSLQADQDSVSVALSLRSSSNGDDNFVRTSDETSNLSVAAHKEVEKTDLTSLTTVEITSELLKPVVKTVSFDKIDSATIGEHPDDKESVKRMNSSNVKLKALKVVPKLTAKKVPLTVTKSMVISSKHPISVSGSTSGINLYAARMSSNGSGLKLASSGSALKLFSESDSIKYDDKLIGKLVSNGESLLDSSSRSKSSISPELRSLSHGDVFPSSDSEVTSGSKSNETSEGSIVYLEMSSRNSQSVKNNRTEFSSKKAAVESEDKKVATSLLNKADLSEIKDSISTVFNKGLFSSFF